MIEHKPKIVFVLYTQGLEYDDRIRKEILYLNKAYDIEILVLTPKNAKEFGTTSYGVPYKSFSLISRKLLPSGKFTLIKSIEFFINIWKHIKKSDIIWTNDCEPFLVPLLLSNKKQIWDLHEIPSAFTSNKITKFIYKVIENKCKLIIHANSYRIDYLKESSVISNKKKHQFLRNFPDNLLLEYSQKDSSYDSFINWLQGCEYIYLQGLQTEERYPIETIDSIIEHGKYKCIVVGGFNESIKRTLTQKHGINLMNEKVYFRGKVDQMNIKPYIDSSKFSIVLYEGTKPNNKYCEPNRMYLSLISDKPVIVGNNPPMRDIVNKYDLGISLKSYGECSNEIKQSIDIIEYNYEKYCNNIRNNKKFLMWEAQFPVLDYIISILKMNNNCILP